LGRPPKNVSKEEKKQAQLDENIRNVRRRKIWHSKEEIWVEFSYDFQIAMTFLVMNLMTLLRRIIRWFFWLFFYQQL